MPLTPVTKRTVNSLVQLNTAGDTPTWTRIPKGDTTLLSQLNMAEVTDDGYNGIEAHAPTTQKLELEIKLFRLGASVVQTIADAHFSKSPLELRIVHTVAQTVADGDKFIKLIMYCSEFPDNMNPGDVRNTVAKFVMADVDGNFVRDVIDLP